MWKISIRKRVGFSNATKKMMLRQNLLLFFSTSVAQVA